MPAFNSFWFYCLYSISVTTTKDGVSDTSQNFVKFTNLLNVANTNAIIKFTSPTYNLSLLGVYNVTINYSWNQYSGS